MISFSGFSWASPSGGILILLGLLSIFVWAVLVEKLILIRRWAPWRDRGLRAARSLIDRGDLTDAGNALEASSHPVAPTLRVLVVSVETALLEHRGLDETVLYLSALRDRVGHRMDDLETILRKRLRPLQAVAAIAPPLGLLGTVIGLVETFQVLETAQGQIHPTALAGGIWSALLTTAAGLIVAIPAIAIHHWIDGAIERVLDHIDHMISEVETVGRQRASSSGSASSTA